MSVGLQSHVAIFKYVFHQLSVILFDYPGMHALSSSPPTNIRNLIAPFQTSNIPHQIILCIREISNALI